jgi:nicotinamide mononucleotide transporter
MLGALNHVLFYLGNDAVTSAEILGFITGLACVYLVVKEHAWNFPIGIANAAFFMVLFLNVRFYADGYLQILYILLGFQGWYAWKKLGPGHHDMVVHRAKVWEILGALGIAAAVTAVLYPLLISAHDLAPWWDALTTGLSIGAQLLLNFKRIQNWYLWVAADIIYVPLYFIKGLDLTGIVYIGFFLLCFMGLAAWRRSLTNVTI